MTVYLWKTSPEAERRTGHGREVRLETRHEEARALSPLSDKEDLEGGEADEGAHLGRGFSGRMARTHQIWGRRGRFGWLAGGASNPDEERRRETEFREEGGSRVWGRLHVRCTGEERSRLDTGRE